MDRTGYVRYRFQRALAEAEGYDLLAMGRPEGQGCYCFPNALLAECIETLERDYRFVVVDSEAGMEHIARGTVRNPDILLITSDPGARGMRTASRIRDLAESLGLSRDRISLVINRDRGMPLPVAICPSSPGSRKTRRSGTRTSRERRSSGSRPRARRGWR